MLIKNRWRCRAAAQKVPEAVHGVRDSDKNVIRSAE